MEHFQIITVLQTNCFSNHNATNLEINDKKYRKIKLSICKKKIPFVKQLLNERENSNKNANRNTTSHDFGEIFKVVLREKFVALNICVYKN